MLDKTQAAVIVKKFMPDGEIQKVIEWKNFYIFQVFRPKEPLENEYDPFYSVDKQTGEFRDFSIFDDGPIDELSALFMKAEVERRQ